MGREMERRNLKLTLGLFSSFLLPRSLNYSDRKYREQKGWGLKKKSKKSEGGEIKGGEENERNKSGRRGNDFESFSRTVISFLQRQIKKSSKVFGLHRNIHGGSILNYTVNVIHPPYSAPLPPHSKLECTPFFFFGFFLLMFSCFK